MPVPLSAASPPSAPGENPSPPLFCLTGIDGCGKSSHIRRLTEWLAETHGERAAHLHVWEIAHHPRYHHHPFITDAAAVHRYLGLLSGGPRTLFIFHGLLESYHDDASDNSLGLTTHPEVMARTKAAIDRWGIGMAGPCTLNGNTTLHQEFEARLAGLDIIEAHPEQVAKLQENTSLVRSRLTAAGFELGGQDAPIIPIYVLRREKVYAIVKEAYERGLFLSLIEYPAVAPGTERIRLTVMATHTPADLEFALGLLIELGRTYGVIGRG